MNKFVATSELRFIERLETEYTSDGNTLTMIKKVLQQKWTKTIGIGPEEHHEYKTTYEWRDVPLELE